MPRVADRHKLATYPELSCALAVAVPQAVSSTAFGSPWPAPPHASQLLGPELDRVLDLAEAQR